MSRRVVGAVALVICLVGGGLVWLVDPLYLRVPKDAAVSRYFQAHKAEFEQLRDMVLNDANLTSRFTANSSDKKLNQDRSRQYESLFAQLPRGIVVTTHRQSVRFIFATGDVYLREVQPQWFLFLQKTD